MAEEGRDFDEVLREAQLKGYAEQDPTFDIEGHDTAQKLIILTKIGFGIYVNQDNFHVEGINHLTLEDIEFAKRELNCCIKLLAISRISNGELEVRVHPTLVSKNHLLASVNDVFNGIYIEGDAVGPVMMYGQGAGMMPTASAVVGDCIDLIEDMDKNVTYGPEKSNFTKIKDINEIKSKYYIRLTVIDKPGVLHEISGILSDWDISLESVNQKIQGGNKVIPLFMVTHESLERNLREALAKIDELDIVKNDETIFIRLL
jgi:homoserine dehydrogenase